MFLVKCTVVLRWIQTSVHAHGLLPKCFPVLFLISISSPTVAVNRDLELLLLSHHAMRLAFAGWDVAIHVISVGVLFLLWYLYSLCCLTSPSYMYVYYLLLFQKLQMRLRADQVMLEQVQQENQCLNQQVAHLMAAFMARQKMVRSI